MYNTHWKKWHTRTRTHIKAGCLPSTIARSFDWDIFKSEEVAKETINLIRERRIFVVKTWLFSRKSNERKTEDEKNKMIENQNLHDFSLDSSFPGHQPLSIDFRKSELSMKTRTCKRVFDIWFKLIAKNIFWRIRVSEWTSSYRKNSSILANSHSHTP